MISTMRPRYMLAMREAMRWICAGDFATGREAEAEQEILVAQGARKGDTWIVQHKADEDPVVLAARLMRSWTIVFAPDSRRALLVGYYLKSHTPCFKQLDFRDALLFETRNEAAAALEEIHRIFPRTRNFVSHRNWDPHRLPTQASDPKAARAVRSKTK